MSKFITRIKEKLKKIKFIKKMYIKIRNPIRRRAINKNGSLVIKEIHSMFKKTNIVYFIDFGTLLGFIREGTFISHDLDIDIGILKANNKEKRIIENKMVDLNFKKEHEFVYKNNVVEQAYTKKNIKVDFFFYEHDRKNSYCYAFYKIPEIKYSNVNQFTTFRFKYSKIKNVELKNINGIRVNIPKNYDKLIVEKYGEKWDIPNEDWSFSDAPTIEKMDDFGKIIK